MIRSSLTPDYEALASAMAEWWPLLRKRKKRDTEENSISGLFIRPTWEKRVIRTKNEGRDEDEAHAV